MGISSEHLPFGQRKKHYRKTVAKRPPKGTSIERRPVDILSRDKFGHWEMDCVVGKQRTKNVLLVLTERMTRYEIINKRDGKISVSGFTGAQKSNETLSKTERKPEKVEINRLFCFFCIFGGY